MLRHLSVLSISTLLVACGGSGSAGLENNPINSPDLGAAQLAPTETRLLEVDKDFGFETARTIDINFDIAQANNEQASVTICTDYDPIGEDDFDINFNSCTITGELSNGAFTESMQVTNDKDAVVAVVLFQDAEIAPMYKEFSVDNTLRAKELGNKVLVWR